jgi:CheY-like chemotaxis protein
VLLDYDLEDGKGTELIEVIRGLRTPPVVIATSARDAGNAALVAAGAHAECSKAKFATIESVLKSCLNRNVPAS